MVEFLKEEEISDGFRAPLCSITTCIPECNVCIYWDGPGKCKKCGVPPDDLCYGRRHDCLNAILDTNRFLYTDYQKLYSAECKKSKKK